MVGVLDRLLLLGFEGGKTGAQALHVRPQRHQERLLFLCRALCEVW